jgi:hypothetical protein
MSHSCLVRVKPAAPQENKEVGKGREGGVHGDQLDWPKPRFAAV